MAKLIIGLAGQIGSGKTHSSRYLAEKYGAESCRFSTALRDIVRRLYLPESREVIDNLSTGLRQIFGEDVLASVISNDAQKATADLVVIDGVRRQQDIKNLVTLPNFKLVYIEAEPKIRYERLTKRGENSDDSAKTWDEFLKDQEREPNSQVLSLKTLASVVIDNNGTPEELHSKLDRLVLGVS